MPRLEQLETRTALSVVGVEPGFSESDNGHTDGIDGESMQLGAAPDERIRVQFHWDRGGDAHDWLRVSELWAGKQWGMLSVPRIGQEVIVAFAAGDPGQPLIVRPLYTAPHDGFGQPAQDTGDVKNTVGAPGGNDSIWLDIGAPVMAGAGPGLQLPSFVFFPGFSGGVTVAAGDVNGDGIDLIVAATSAAPNGHVKVFNGQDGSLRASFVSFPGFNGGVHVAAGDVNSDGFVDVVKTAGPGAGPHVNPAWSIGEFSKIEWQALATALNGAPVSPCPDPWWLSCPRSDKRWTIQFTTGGDKPMEYLTWDFSQIVVSSK